MKLLNRIIITVALCYSAFASVTFYYAIYGVLPFYGGRWKMVWHDEFKGSALDLSKWSAQTQGTDYNQEIQAYKDENVIVKNGCLMMVSHKENWTGPDNFHPGRLITRHYTSAHIVTEHIKTWTYGRFEMRAKIPTAYGFRPYVSLMSPETWPPEIVMIIGSADKNRRAAVFMEHYWGWDYLHYHVESSKPFFGSDYAAQYHIYTMEWEPHRIRWYIDGVEKYQTNRGVPDEALYLEIKTSVGGAHQGDSWQKVQKSDPDPNPQCFYIDWIRVYQRK